MKKVMREEGEIGAVRLVTLRAIGHGGVLTAGKARGHQNPKHLVTLIRVFYENFECPNST